MNREAALVLKARIHEHCEQLVQKQLDTIQGSLDQLMEAKTNETKSSAGDKYETGMAMIQNQEELLKRQQLEARNRMRVLESIHCDIRRDTIDTGSLVQLSTGWFYMAVAIGKLKIEEQDLYVISMQSPLGQLMKGKRHSDVIVLNAKEITVISIY